MASNAAHVPEDRGDAIAMRSLILTPVKLPVLIRSPPTSLLMHSRVTYCVTLGSARRSDSESFCGWSTSPPRESFHLWPSTTGSLKFLETT